MNFIPNLISALTKQVSRVLQKEYQQNKQKYNAQVSKIKGTVEDLNQLQMDDLDIDLFDKQEQAIIYRGKEAMASNRELTKLLPISSNILDEFITLQSDIYQKLKDEIEKNSTLIKDLDRLVQQKVMIGNTKFFGNPSEKITIQIVLELIAPPQIEAIFIKNPEFLDRKINRTLQLSPNAKKTALTFCRQDFARLQKVDKQYQQILLTLSNNRHCYLQAKRCKEQITLILIVNCANPVVVERNKCRIKVQKGDDEFTLQQFDKIVLLYSDQNDLISYQLTQLK